MSHAAGASRPVRRRHSRISTRIPDRIAEAEDLMGRVTAAIEARATKRATETLGFLSALVLLPTAIASFGLIWLDHGDTPDGQRGFAITVLISVLAALLTFAWIHRGWGLRALTISRPGVVEGSHTPTSNPGKDTT